MERHLVVKNESQKRAEFAELLRANQARLYGFIHALVRNLDDADDLLQQSAIILWNKFDLYDRQRSFFSWACGIARFEIANFLRARGRKKLYLSDDLNLLLIETADQLPADDMEDQREALESCIQKLRDSDRQLVHECYKNEEDVNGVAERMGRSSHSVYNSLRRIRQSLYECIQRTMASESRPRLGT